MFRPRSDRCYWLSLPTHSLSKNNQCYSNSQFRLAHYSHWSKDWCHSSKHWYIHQRSGLAKHWRKKVRGREPKTESIAEVFASAFVGQVVLSYNFRHTSTSWVQNHFHISMQIVLKICHPPYGINPSILILAFVTFALKKIAIFCYIDINFYYTRICTIKNKPNKYCLTS